MSCCELQKNVLRAGARSFCKALTMRDYLDFKICVELIARQKFL